MSDEEQQRFKYVNNEQPQEGEVIRPSNDKMIMNRFDIKQEFKEIQGLGDVKFKQNSLQQSTIVEEITEEQRIKDRQIRKLTNINKHLLEKLKQQNDQLTKRVNKQKFRIPKKSIAKIQPKHQQNARQIQSLKRQLESSYRQIDFYKQTISSLKAKQAPLDEQDKVNQAIAKLKQKNDYIQKTQHQIKTQKTIKAQQDKQLGKFLNQEMNDLLKKFDQQVTANKNKLKELKKNLNKKQQLQKKQHSYLLALEAFIKKSKREQESEQSQFPQSITPVNVQQEISQLQWKQVKQKLAQQKKKYEEYGKKLNYNIFIKSKQAKNFEQIELKYKQKLKIVEKLKNKLNEVNKLAKLKPKPEILQRVDLKMEKLKDIISRQSTIEMASLNKIKTRVQSEDAREFKKWELQRASRQDSDLLDQSQQNKRNKNQSQEENEQNLKYQIPNFNKKNQEVQIA